MKTLHPISNLITHRAN